MTALSFAIEFLGQLPALISAGIDVADLITKTNGDLKKMQEENRDPSDAEWEDLNKVIEQLRIQRPDVSGE